MSHYVESFREDGRYCWGWHCLTCGASTDGFLTLAKAELAGADHGEAS